MLFFTIETVSLSFIRFLPYRVGVPGCLFIESQGFCVYIRARSRSRSGLPSNQVFNYVLFYLLILIIFFEFQTIFLMLMIAETLRLTALKIRYFTTFSLLPLRSQLCVLSACTILSKHHQVNLGFPRLLPSGLLFKCACLLLTSGSPMVFVSHFIRQMSCSHCTIVPYIVCLF